MSSPGSRALWKEIARIAGVPALVPAGVVIAHVIMSQAFDAYDRLTWIDIPVHLIGGVAIGYFFSATLLGLQRVRVVIPMDVVIHSVLVFGLVAVAAVSWEFLEFIFDMAFETNVQRSIANVMQDQLVGLIGGAVIVGVRIPTIRRAVGGGGP